MEVMIPLKQQHQEMDFDFTSALTTPYATAPSTPKRFGHFSYINSAPTSPVHEFYNYQHEFHQDRLDGFQSEISKEDEFAFEFSEELEKTSLSAEELFDGGKIKSFRGKSPKSPISQGKQMIQHAFSSKQKSKQIDDSEYTLEKTIGDEARGLPDHERFQMASNSNRRSSARSLSSYRVSQCPWDDQQTQNPNPNPKQSTTKTNKNSKPQSISISSATASASLTSSSSSSSLSSSSKSKRWSLRDFFLFRSASEGRASDKDPLKKYSFITNKKQENVKNSSFRLLPDSGSVSKRRASAHEMHYNMNRAAAEESRKKTFLPYKQGILGKHLWFM